MRFPPEFMPCIHGARINLGITNDFQFCLNLQSEICNLKFFKGFMNIKEQLEILKEKVASTGRLL
jgi:hypothetical protein